MTGITGRRIAIIGGAGFIGHHLALYLQERGGEVTVIDSLGVNNVLHVFASGRDLSQQRLYEAFLLERIGLLRRAGIDLIIQDARDYAGLTHAITRSKAEVIIHLAAVAHAGRSNKDPYSTFDHSLRTLENALDNARDRIEHFIYFSSSMVYGHFKSSGVDETTPCEPLGIYGALKFAGEKLVIAYSQVFELPITIVRPSALYGERCISRRVGQIFIENALAGREVVIAGDGNDRLDFTYILDLCQGVECILKSDKSKGEVFNITYGESRSIGQMAAILRECFPDLKIRYEPKDKLTPDRGTLLVDKARHLLGYHPAYPLERGFRKYIDWYRSVWRESGDGR